MPPAATPAAEIPAVETPVAPASVSPATIVLEHPAVVDTARLSGQGTVVALYGITGTDDPAHGLQEFIRANGDRVTCTPQPGQTFTCLMPDRTDVASVSLANGAARTAADAPVPYRAEEDQAQAARRGIWSNLPQPPVLLAHPRARTTGMIMADGKAYPLDGMEGIAGKAVQDLQGYIASHGDTLLCQPQGDSGRFLCTLPDGTDIGKVALVNGAARVASDAPDSYRLQQAEALENQRGLWASAPRAPAVATAYPPAPGYALAPEDVSGPVAYAGDQPTALIEGETVFLTYGDGLGWGYYDHFHHWRGAPDRYARHLERFHPDGRGLRGYEDRHFGYGGERRGFVHGEPGFHPGFYRERTAFAGRPEMGFARGGAGPAFAHNGAGFVRGAGPAQAAFGRPAGPQMAMPRPPAALAHAAPARICGGRHC